MNGPRWKQNKVDGFNGNLYRYGTRKITNFGEHYKELLAEILS